MGKHRINHFFEFSFYKNIMKPKLILYGIVNFLLCHLFSTSCFAQEVKLFPYKYQTLPDITSPVTLKNGMEVMICVSVSGEYVVLPVTQEKGEIYSCLYGFRGKGDQLWIDAPDFPSLGKTGLHSDEELNRKAMITGRSIDVINYIARPGRFSGSGFISEDEDIISVLKGDNKMVKRLGLEHNHLAKPLFHVWNAVLGNYLRRGDQNKIFYNGNALFIKFDAGKGYQESIFHDEIEGKYDIQVWRNLNKKELETLHKKYSELTQTDFDVLVEKLTHIHFSEMLPFYIMRYGFYEGHTDFRCDPVATAFIFGFKSLKEINEACDGELYHSLTKHYVRTCD